MILKTKENQQTVLIINIGNLLIIKSFFKVFSIFLFYSSARIQVSVIYCCRMFVFREGFNQVVIHKWGTDIAAAIVFWFQWS